MEKSLFNRFLSGVKDGLWKTPQERAQYRETASSLFSSAISRVGSGVQTGVGVVQSGVARFQQKIEPISRPIQKVGEFMLPIELANQKGQEKYLQLKKHNLPQEDIEIEVRNTINREYLKYGIMNVKGELSIEDGIVSYTPEQVVDPTFGIGAIKRVFSGLSRSAMKKIAQSTTRKQVTDLISKEVPGISASLRSRMASELTPAKSITEVASIMEKYNARIGSELGKKFTAPKGISTHYERTKHKIQSNLSNDIEIYQKINLEDQSIRSARLVTQDVTKARRAGLGIEKAPEGLLPEAIMAAVAENYRAAGQLEKARYFSRRLSSKLTEAAQTLNVAKIDISSVGDSFLEGIIIRERIANMGSKVSDLSETNIKKGINMLKTESRNQAIEINNVINARSIEDLVSKMPLSTEQRNKLFKALSEHQTISNIADLSLAGRLRFLNQHFDSKTARVVNAKIETELIHRQKEAINLWAKKNIDPERLANIEERIGIIDDVGSLTRSGLESLMEDLTLSRLKVDILPKEAETLSKLTRSVSTAREKMGDYMIYTNRNSIDDFLTKKGELERFYKKLNPDSLLDVFSEGARGSMLLSSRSAMNSAMFQGVPGVTTSLVKRLSTWTLIPGDYKIVDRIISRLSGSKELSIESQRFWREQVKFGVEMYHKHGVDISRMQTLQDGFTMFGEKVVMPYGKSFGEARGVAEKFGALVRGHARLMKPGTKYMAGGTDAIFANMHRAGTTQFLAKQAVNLEIRAGKLKPEMRAAREMEIIKDAYRLPGKDTPFEAGKEVAWYIRDQAMKDAHRANWTGNDWYGKAALKIRDAIPFRLGKIIVPFLKIPANVVGAGFEAATGVGHINGLKKIVNAFSLPNGPKKNSQIADGLHQMISNGGYQAAALTIVSLLNTEDYIGAYDYRKRSENELSITKNAGANYIRIGDKWVSLRWLGPLAIPIAGMMEARQAQAMGDSAVIGYGRGVIAGLMEAPLIKESFGSLAALERASAQKDTRKFMESVGIDYESLKKWIEPRLITSFMAYDVQGLFDETKYDAFGRPIPEKTFKNFIIGANIKQDTSNVLSDEFERLRMTGNLPTLVEPEGKHIDFIKNVADAFDETIYTDFMRARKESYAMESLKLFISNEYKTLTPEEQKKAFDDIRRKEIFEPAEKFADELREFIRTGKYEQIIK